eukprot:778279-Pelagomonas_calceolata.AAC.1
MQASLLRSQTMAGVVAPAASRRMLVVQNAHKKGAGSTKNGRDSNSKSRGVKVFGGQPVKAGGIIVRQTGSTVVGLAQQQSGATHTNLQPSIRTTPPHTHIHSGTPASTPTWARTTPSTRWKTAL